MNPPGHDRCATVTARLQGVFGAASSGVCGDQRGRFGRAGRGRVRAGARDHRLDHQRIGHRIFDDVTSGLKAVQTGTLDAFVYDRPLLSWAVRQDFPALQVLGVTLDQQNYAIALPPNSNLRLPLDTVLLDSVASDWWALENRPGSPVGSRADRRQSLRSLGRPQPGPRDHSA